MSSATKAVSVVTEKGDAIARIKGVNHIQLVVHDMNASIVFYRDLLGFKVIRTMGEEEMTTIAQRLGIAEGHKVVKNYFFDMGNGNLLTLIEVTGPVVPQRSTYAGGLWVDDGKGKAPEAPNKMDHMAFNVETRDDLVWFQNHLRSHGVTVSEIKETAGGHFVKSIYFYDPSGIPLEIATFDYGDPIWESHKPEDWLGDPDPEQAMLPG